MTIWMDGWMGGWALPERHQTPMQLWMSGIVQQSQSSSTAIRNALNFNIDAEVLREHHSLDWEGGQSTRLMSQTATSMTHYQKRD